MHSINWHSWLADVGQKFPAIREWVRGITPEADYNALLDAWEKAMHDLDLQDCLEANARMLSGELDGPGDFPSHWQSLPARMRRHVRAIRDERAGMIPMSVRDKQEHLRTVLIRSRRKAGIPLEKINAELVAAGFDGLNIPKQ